jgi:DNA-binding GntR family transcriptional regulator
MANQSSSSKVQELTDKLRKAILSGKYPPGTVFFQETLAKEFNVSRTPVREALKKLEHEGIVETGKRRQIMVRGSSYQDLNQIYRLREVFDGLGARLLAEERDTVLVQEAIEKLDHILMDMKKVIDFWDPLAWSNQNVLFHSTIVKYTKNTHLINQLSIIHMSGEMFYPAVVTNPTRAQVALDEHRIILQAIKQGDADLAENIARLHIRSAQKIIEKLYKSK